MTHLAPSIVTPASDFPSGPVTIPSGVALVVFSGTLFDRLAAALRLAPDPPEWTNSRMPLRLSTAGVAVHFPLYGSPRTAAALEQLAYCGVHTVLGVGFCGSLDERLTIGSAVGAVAALRGDAVSRHYAPSDAPAVPDGSLYRAALGALRDMSAIDAIVASTDALYRETPEAADGWRASGASAVDMECGTFLTVARALGLRAAWFATVSDTLWQNSHAGGVGGLSTMDAAVRLGERLHSLACQLQEIEA